MSPARHDAVTHDAVTHDAVTHDAVTHDAVTHDPPRPGAVWPETVPLPAVEAIGTSGSPHGARRIGRTGIRRLAVLTGQALWWTLWWGGLLVGAGVLIARVFPQAGFVLPLAVATWVSYVLHEVGHAAAATALGAPAAQVHVVRRGPGLGVTAPAASARATRLTALAGPLVGAGSGVAVATGLGLALGLPASGLAVACAVVLANHLVNLLPVAPDGRHVFGR